MQRCTKNIFAIYGKSQVSSVLLLPSWCKRERKCAASENFPVKTGIYNRLFRSQNRSQTVDRKNRSQTVDRKNQSQTVDRKNRSRTVGRKNQSQTVDRKNQSQTVDMKNGTRKKSHSKQTDKNSSSRVRTLREQWTLKKSHIKQTEEEWCHSPTYTKKWRKKKRNEGQCSRSCMVWLTDWSLPLKAVSDTADKQWDWCPLAPLPQKPNMLG